MLLAAKHAAKIDAEHPPRRSLRRRTLRFVLFAALGLVPACRGATPPPLQLLNADFRVTYAEARARSLAAEGPIVLATGDELILFHDGAMERRVAIPSAYHDLKAVAHLPLAIFVTLHDRGGQLDESTRARLEGLHARAVGARAAAESERLPPEARVRQARLLSSSLEFLDATLSSGRSEPAEVTAFARRSAPLVLESAKDAARLQIEGYDAVIAEWRSRIPPEEWQSASAVVSGSALPRAGALGVQYFAQLFGESGEGRRVIYSESVYDPERMLRLRATHQLDRRIAEAFFEDDERMHRDLLSDAARELLSER